VLVLAHAGLAATGRTAVVHELLTELCALGLYDEEMDHPATAASATTRKPSPTPRCCKPPCPCAGPDQSDRSRDRRVGLGLSR
jgi:hypothetical protein